MTSEEWFVEKSPMWPGQAFSLQVKDKLLDKQSSFQHIQVYETSNYGKMLVLDGAIQCTERDESSYQEMITFLPLNSHPNPKKVLIIGGGDGGVAREVDKHPLVEKIVQCEIDSEVINACKTHIPSMGCGFSSPKLTLCTGDGANYLEDTDEVFDVIITDASDPVVAGDKQDTKDGPAVSLFNEHHYSKMKKRLTSDGIICCQGENMWLHSDLIVDLLSECKKLYPVIDYAYTCTPTYPGGQIGFILCSKNPMTNFRKPVTRWNTDEDTEKYSLNYYNEEIHQSAFILPTFMKKQLKLLTQN